MRRYMSVLRAQDRNYSGDNKAANTYMQINSIHK